ncbi:MAG: hypothetical protein AAB319_06485, partial [Pseudomonadota bacterium]
DPYTVRFYSQMVERVLGKLKSLCLTRKAEAVALSDGMHRFWKPAWMLIGMPVVAPDFSRLWDESDMGKIQTCIFPPELSGEDIGRQGAEYEKQVKAVCAALMESVAAEPEVQGPA